jgi:integrase/recombinase XerD
MPRTDDATRSCLQVTDWPEVDQSLWSAMLVPAAPEDEVDGVGAQWRPTTRQTLREGYGRWLGYLMRYGADMTISPAQRVTAKHVRGYLQELEDQGLSPQTRCNRISELMSVMKAFAPQTDWSWLRRRMNRFALLAAEARQQKAPPLLSGDILAKALAALTAASRDRRRPDIDSAIAYRNWLMVAMITLIPLRRHNFAGLSIETNLRRRDGDWFFEIPAEDAKTHREIVMPIPTALHRHIQFYLDEVRPMLLAGVSSDRLWITVRRTPMTDHSFWVCMTNFTRKVLGVAINPHRFRHIGATSAVIAEPEMMEAARAFLGHGDSQTTKDHYLLGQSLVASRKHANLIDRLRREHPPTDQEAGNQRDVREAA